MASVPSTDAMEVAVILDAKEPDGPHDETVGLENDLAEAVEVKLDGDGMVVLENNLGGAIEVFRKAGCTGTLWYSQKEKKEQQKKVIVIMYSTQYQGNSE